MSEKGMQRACKKAAARKCDARVPACGELAQQPTLECVCMIFSPDYPLVAVGNARSLCSCSDTDNSCKCKAMCILHSVPMSFLHEVIFTCSCALLLSLLTISERMGC